MTLPKIPPMPTKPQEGVGDMRGAYGYGRPAHGSDPAARYGFEPQPSGLSTKTEFVDEIAREFSEKEDGG